MLQLAAIALTLASTSFNASQDAGRMMHLKGPENSFERLLLSINDERLDPPKVSPKHQWIFEWVTAGLGRQAETDNYYLRFRVFCQLRKENDDPAMMTTRLLLRLWDFNVRKLGFDHAPIFDQGAIHVYLCYGGKPGGEQMFTEDIEDNIPKRVNTIYIYSLPTFTVPVEMLREVAHEYGHATLPPVGGFKTPEDWANGYLGEKLYMRWMLKELQANRLKPVDAMNATAKDIEAFVKREVDPLMDAIALKGIDTNLMRSEGQIGMDGYMGLALYAESLLPSKIFGRSLGLNASLKAEDYPAAIALAVETQVEADKRLLLTIPDRYKEKDVWVPTGENGRVANATILKRDKGWALIKPGIGSISVLPPKE
ncbi:MAG: hypothetical protein KF784_14830 [Fimbriimonadaceae bacterium]|nr:hypothetical protein [Fimbriimonadaceae bacterium]